jgi:hypothetical protein
MRHYDTHRKLGGITKCVHGTIHHGCFGVVRSHGGMNDGDVQYAHVHVRDTEGLTLVAHGAGKAGLEGVEGLPGVRGLVGSDGIPGKVATQCKVLPSRNTIWRRRERS